jgi:hypothetical protein
MMSMFFFAILASHEGAEEDDDHCSTINTTNMPRRPGRVPSGPAFNVLSSIH